MALVNSLLTAIVRADGDAMVLHVGEKPYVVASAGPIDLSSQILSLDVMSGMLGQLLPANALHDLAEFGAIEHAVDAPPEIGPDTFTVVAARGGDDVWIEIRRQRAITTPPLIETPERAVRDEHGSHRAAPVVHHTRREEIDEPDADDVPTVIDTQIRETPSRVDTAPVEAPPPAPAAPQIPELATESERPEPVAVPLTRTLRIEVPTRGSESRRTGIERLLVLAAERNATTLFLTSQSQPAIRVDGDLKALEGENLLTSGEIEAALRELLPASIRESASRGEPTDWTADVPEVGRVHCTTFRDYRGFGALFQLMSGRPATAESLGLGREIQGLASEGDGLVLVASPRSAGKTTLIGALVDLINRQRADYVISLERQVRLVHDNRHSLISQRELGDSAASAVEVARSALRENPDVLVFDDLHSADLCAVALEAAGSGLLVIASIAAGSAPAAISRLLELAPAPARVEVQERLAEYLRGVVSQVLLRRVGGGRIAARELLLTTSSIATMLRQGQLTQLPLAIDSGRKHGMISLNDSLVSYVRSGAVDIREAYRKADDRETLLAMLKRDSIDTTFVERLA